MPKQRPTRTLIGLIARSSSSSDRRRTMPGGMLTRSVTLVALACTTIVMAAPAVASAGTCDASVASAGELHTSITNPACEGRVIRIRPGTYVPEIEVDPGDPRSSSFNVTVNDLDPQGLGQQHPFERRPRSGGRRFRQRVSCGGRRHDGGRFDSIREPLGRARKCGYRRRPGPVFRESRGRRRHQDLRTVGWQRVHAGRRDRGRQLCVVGWCRRAHRPSFAAQPSVMARPPRIVIDHARFENNLAGIEPTEGQPGGPGAGGGLAAFYADVDVAHTTFQNNRAGFGGAGMETNESSVSVRHSRFIDNTSVGNSAAFRILAWDPAVEKASTDLEQRVREQSIDRLRWAGVGLSTGWRRPPRGLCQS